MTLAEALDIVIARTGHKRYRFLCLQHPRPQVRAQYSDLVMRLAARPEQIRPTPPGAAELAQLQGCPFRSAGTDGCQCSRCGLRSGAKVSSLECLVCVRQYPEPQPG
jgi:hypothetical protein